MIWIVCFFIVKMVEETYIFQLQWTFLILAPPNHNWFWWANPFHKNTSLSTSLTLRLSKDPSLTASFFQCPSAPLANLTNLDAGTSHTTTPTAPYYLLKTKWRLFFNQTKWYHLSPMYGTPSHKCLKRQDLRRQTFPVPRTPFRKHKWVWLRKWPRYTPRQNRVVSCNHQGAVVPAVRAKQIRIILPKPTSRP
jgi:hypothetical protein